MEGGRKGGREGGRKEGSNYCRMPSQISNCLTQSDVLLLQYCSVLLYQSTVDPIQGNGIVMRVIWEDGGGSKQNPCLGPHKS